MSNNRRGNCNNRFQGESPRILCVCSAGLLRSPTLAWVLSNEPWNCNTRAVGCDNEYALIPIDDVLIEWADGIVCASQEHVEVVKGLALGANVPLPPIISLDIPDKYDFRDPTLVGIIEHKLHEVGFDPTKI